MDYAVEQMDPKNHDMDSTSILIEHGEDISLKYKKALNSNDKKKEKYDRFGFSIDKLQEIKESNSEKDFKLYLQ